MKVLFVIGTRPEAIKLCPVIIAARNDPDLEAIVLSTGQHQDMLHNVLAAFDVRPDYELDVMRPNQTPAGVASRVLADIDQFFDEVNPDWVVVQGDTTTVATVAIAAFYAKRRVAHVEAGLRTGIRGEPFPEEINRRLAAVASDIHFAPTETAKRNLLAEGIQLEHVLVTGNTVIDALRWSVGLPPTDSFKDWMRRIDLGQDGRRLILVTAHRRENIGAPLESICDAITELCASFGDEVRVFYPVHRNPNVLSIVERRLSGVPQVVLGPPVDYVTLIQIMQRATLVLTDSGGIQEEAPSLSKPVLVLRDVTERPEAVEAGTVRVVGTNAKVIVREVSTLLRDASVYERMARAVNPYGDGAACERIVGALLGRAVQPFVAK